MPPRPPRNQPSYDDRDRDLPPPPPSSSYASPQQPSSYTHHQSGNERPALAPVVSFFDSPLPPRSSSHPQPNRQHSSSSKAYNNHTLDGEDSVDVDSFPTEQLPYGFAPHGDGQGGTAGGDFRRKKSLVRPDRERIDPGDRLFHYRQHAAQMEEQGTGRVGVIPSATGNVPVPSRAPLRRGKSILAREEDQAIQESGLSLFKRGNTLRRKNTAGTTNGADGMGRATRATRKKDKEMEKLPEDRGFWGGIAPGPVDGWMIYCYLLTFLVPGFVLRGVFGKRTREAQRAWREKMGLVSVILIIMAFVGFLTFGFTKTVCGTPANRTLAGTVQEGTLIINGYTYDLGNWFHPSVGEFNGSQNPLFTADYMAGGKDASFMFQKVNENCRGIIGPSNDTGISPIDRTAGTMAWYFPCNLREQGGSSPNVTGVTSNHTCHITNKARTQYYDLPKTISTGQVYYDWANVTNPDRNLVVYQTTVLDLDILQWLQASQTTWPVIYDYMKVKNASYQGLDLSMFAARSGLQKEMACLQDIATVGFISTKTIGCVASDVVLYVSLVFIIGVVSAKFAMAVAFGWFLSWRLGSFKGESYAQRMARSAAIESWTDDIYRPAPSRYRPNVAQGGKGAKNRGTVFLPTTSRFSKAESMMVTSSRPSTTYGGGPNGGGGGFGRSNTASTYGTKGLLSASPLGGDHNTPPGSPGLHESRSSNSLPFGRDDSSRNSFSDPSISHCPFPLHNVIPQPPADYEPFNFPLLQNILLVTAYSESLEGLRTTIDSLATTDYPNSHKVILVIADGMVRGSGSKLRTPDIVLSMMKELVIPAEEVEAHSYVAIADGHKRHNMAKVYAGFYDYDDDTVEISKQQRVPIVLVAKVGNPLEAHDSKPGNRGKRDSQIVLMAFLQKVMFDERMTTFEYEFFNSLWRVTGVSPDRYEGVLCVDADTKVFPDSLTRMSAAMHNDPEIMGLCGETKIANKSETWVTMIQVFEYYISHHQTKAFEAVFGGVTCLPGCFSMYRIKAPKGESGYWVPLLANPDIIEHYSENVVDTLHKKNLLLLGEDRYLSTLMLKTFPKRKMVFIPQAVCKTVVPDTFRILLSQRRRWINSTIHNLFELLFVRDLCGTFCFSMQFVVFMELVGTLVLPAAIAFTIYLIVVACIPSQPTPVIPLILLAIILGLPGLLIVITSRKIAYVGWMLIYLFSLPIWNFVLPAYSYWRFDDFSWGETRKIEGDNPKEEGHGDKDGVFDSSSIVMKRWAEFERERRWKSGTQSRDSYYDVVQRSSSPRRGENRYSMASTAETYFGGSSEGPVFGNGRPSQSFNSTTQSSYGPNFQASAAAAPSRQDHVPLLELPAPLGPRTGSGQDSSSTEEDDYSRTQPMERSMTSSTAGLGSSNESYNSNGPFQDRYQQQQYYNSSPSAEDHSPDPNAAYSPTTALRSPIDSDYDDGGAGAGSSSRLSHQAGGVSLVDNGFLPPQQTAERVRRVARNAQRRTSGNVGVGATSPVSSRPGASSPVSSRTSHPTGHQAPAGGYARFDRSHQ